MEVGITKVGSREFLNLGDVVVPVDKIRVFDFNVPNGGASGNSVQVVTDDPDSEIIFAFENCDAIREWLNSNSLKEQTK